MQHQRRMLVLKTFASIKFTTFMQHYLHKGNQSATKKATTATGLLITDTYRIETVHIKNRIKFFRQYKLPANVHEQLTQRVFMLLFSQLDFMLIYFYA